MAKEGTLKRTRRVEVIRYSRRSTVVSDEVAFERELAGEQPAFDVLLKIPGPTESATDDISSAEDQAPSGVSADVAQRPQPLRFLKRLIRG